MRAAILGLPTQLRWAADVAPPPAPGGTGPILLCGLGGSAMAGDVAREVAEGSGALAVVHRGYGLPAWAQESGALVVLISYSGNTEEVLSAADAAEATGLRCLAVASGGVLAERAAASGWPLLGVPGGMQPRAALGYQAGAVLRLLEGAGRIPAQSGDLAEAAAVLEEGFAGGEEFRVAAEIADLLAGRIPIVYGTVGPAAIAARRWKTQINENAKVPAYWQEIPELNHNEIEGWAGAAAMSVVFLRDGAEHPRVAQRADITREIVAADMPVAGEVWGRGAGIPARIFSLIGTGDLVSVALADRAGIDPTPVDRIQGFKQRLAEEA